MARYGRTFVRGQTSQACSAHLLTTMPTPWEWVAVAGEASLAHPDDRLDAVETGAGLPRPLGHGGVQGCSRCYDPDTSGAGGEKRHRRSGGKGRFDTLAL